MGKVELFPWRLEDICVVWEGRAKGGHVSIEWGILKKFGNVPHPDEYVRFSRKTQYDAPDKISELAD